MTERIWECKIGSEDAGILRPGADSPMRRAVEAAFRQVTGVEASFTFSGWGAELTPTQAEVVNGTGEFE